MNDWWRHALRPPPRGEVLTASLWITGSFAAVLVIAAILNALLTGHHLG